MATALRWVVRGLFGFLTIALVETGIWGIPENIAEQVAFLTWLNETGFVRLIVALALAALLAGATVGPTRLREWQKLLSDWWYSDAQQVEQLQTENKQLRAFLEKLTQAKPSGTHARGTLTVKYPEPPAEAKQLEEQNQRLKKEIEQLKAQIPQPNDEELRQRCCKLSTEIFEFYRRQRQHMEDSLEAEHWDRIFDFRTREQKRQDAIASHDRWIIDQYGRDFGSKMLALSDDLAQRQWITPKEQKTFKNPTKPQDIQYIAQRLDVICHRSDGN